jgi:hypothetical protein
LEHFFLFFHSVGNVIIPTDEVHHFSEGVVETTNQVILRYFNSPTTTSPLSAGKYFFRWVGQPPTRRNKSETVLECFGSWGIFMEST